MHFIPGKPKFFVQEGLQKTVVADDLQRSLLPLGGEGHAAVFLIIGQRRICGSQPLDHAGGRSWRHAHLLGDLIR